MTKCLEDELTDVLTLYHHAPPGYVCPFCLVVAGAENEHVWTMQGDVVLRDDLVTAFVAAG